MLLELDLRKSKTSSGTTDVAGKVGFTQDTLNIGVTVSAPPSVTFSTTENGSVYERAYLANFDY